MNWSRAGGRVVAGSNPVTPTAENQGVKINILTPFFLIPTTNLQHFFRYNMSTGKATRL